MATGRPTSRTPSASPQAESVGQLVLGPRGRGESFSPADRRLLDDLARQIGIAAHVVRLTSDLQRSRERLVTAREEERRRLRRDLHDGLGPTLGGLTLKVGAIRNLLPRDQAVADALLAELSTEIEGAVGDIRRRVYDLRSPSLDELGLVEAIRARAAHYCLPAAIEVAAYRIVLEALANVARHAQAQTCRMCLRVADALEVEVSDDGFGLPAERHTGVGLLANTGMRSHHCMGCHGYFARPPAPASDCPALCCGHSQRPSGRWRSLVRMCDVATTPGSLPCGKGIFSQ